MGLDISAYGSLKRLDDQSDRDNFDIYLFKNDTIFSQSEGIEPGGYESHGESFGFGAGSYSGYGNWRKMLAKFVGYDSIEELWDEMVAMKRDDIINKIIGDDLDPLPPFSEILYFSDCEGYIGPVVSKKLYNDFISLRERAVEFSSSTYGGSGRNYFMENYDDFMNAFRIASNGGAVTFH